MTVPNPCWLICTPENVISESKSQVEILRPFINRRPTPKKKKKKDSIFDLLLWLCKYTPVLFPTPKDFFKAALFDKEY